MTASVAIITGASQGIGAGYRDAGYAVVGAALSFPPVDRDEGDCVEVAREFADAQCARRAVRVNAVSLGVVKTPVHDAASYKRLDGLHPLGRVGEVAHVVDAILYLGSATFVIGETLHVDGGQTAGPGRCTYHLPPCLHP